MNSVACNSTGTLYACTWRTAATVSRDVPKVRSRLLSSRRKLTRLNFSAGAEEMECSSFLVTSLVFDDVSLIAGEATFDAGCVVLRCPRAPFPELAHAFF